MTRQTVRRELGEEEVLAEMCSLWVPHLAADGSRTVKMCGKVVSHRDQLVFQHSQSGSQYHRKYDCPAAIDLRIVTLLDRSGISLIYVLDRRRGYLWRTDLERMKDAHVAFYDGRNRLYLPTSGWDRQTDIAERQEGPNTVIERVYYTPGDMRRVPVMTLPFIPLELIVSSWSTY